MRKAWFSAAAVAALSAALVAAPASAKDSSTTPRYGSWGFELRSGDKSVKPGDDFYRFAEGLATDQMQIPADRTRYGSLDKLTAVSEARVHLLLEKALANPTPQTAQMVAFYKSFMDEAKVEALGAKPLAANLEAIRAARTREALARFQGSTTDTFGQGFFGIGIQPDLKNAGHYAVYLSQDGLSLPDRDYYLDPRFAEKKTAFQSYVASTLKLAGWADADRYARAIVDLETAIALASWPKADTQDPEKVYNPTTVADLERTAPGFPWKAFLEGAHVGGVTRVVANENTAFPKIAAIYAATPIDVLQAWQAFTVVDAASPFLSKRFVDNLFEFRGKTLIGQPQQYVRWRRAVTATNAVLGEAVGEQYVATYFPPEAKAQMEDMVANLKAAMAVRIQNVSWMSPQTKARALEKLSRFRVKIAYPDKWRDYAGLTIDPGDLYGNVERASAFDWARHVARLNGLVDRDEWGMTPQTVNAYYNWANNEIVFPAAILQPPFFDPDADPAINYGGIGGTIGHEITHAFDDAGRKFDAGGELSDWWTPEDLAKFNEKTRALGAQYSALEPIPGSHINGELTMGENIADLGGLNLALDAYHASLKGRPAPIIDGLTGDQRVFLGWAQVWRSKTRDDALRQQLVSDPHAPDMARVNIPVRNIDAWYAAFDVKPGDKLYLPPEQRVKIW